MPNFIEHNEPGIFPWVDMLIAPRVSGESVRIELRFGNRDIVETLTADAWRSRCIELLLDVANYLQSSELSGQGNRRGDGAEDVSAEPR